MWSEKLENGKYKFTERYRDPLTGKLKKVSIVKEKDNDHTRKTAQTELSKKISEKSSQANIYSTITVGQLITAYKEAQKHEVRESTYHRNCIQMKAVERILGTDTLVCRLTAPIVRKAMIDTGESNGRMNERLTRLSACVRWGIRNDKVKDASWIDKVGRFSDKSEREKVEGKYLESEELKKLIDAMDIERWNFLTIFLALTGMRIGEAIALDDEDVNTDSMIISITKTYNTVNNQISPFTKTAMSERDIHIQPELLKIIREIRKKMLEQRMMFGYAKTEYFFTDTDGDRVHYDSYRQYLGDMTQKIVGRRLTPHALRHTHTSLLAEQGVTLEAISRRLGHADSEITKKIYLHVTEKMKEKDNLELDAVNIL